MHRLLKRVLPRIVIALITIVFFEGRALAASVYVVDVTESFLKCSIGYSLIGKYVAHFNKFEGTIDFDPGKVEDSQVDLKVQTKSIESKYPRLDRFARSKRLLDATQFPLLTFKSKSIKKVKDKLYVTGTFNMHSVSQELTLPFDFKGPFLDKDKKRHYAVGEGKWKINRKTFGIVWDKHLDKGGVLVDDYVVIDWKVMAYEK